MENKKVYFKMTEVKKYEKETGKFTGKAQIYLENGNAMEPHYITTGTGRKIEEIHILHRDEERGQHGKALPPLLGRHLRKIMGKARGTADGTQKLVF